MDKIEKLKEEAEKKSRELLNEKQQLVAQSQKMQQRVQQIDIAVIALAGKIEGFNELLGPEKDE